MIDGTDGIVVFHGLRGESQRVKKKQPIEVKIEING